MKEVNHKATRQALKRYEQEGKRYARQKGERNMGPNTRVYSSLGAGRGYVQIRLRDGKQVSKTPV